jgi:uncharacterized membrane protein (UPF0127 family)
MEAARLRSLPRRRALGIEAPVALGFRARLLGLAGLRRERVGTGLLLPRCDAVHSFGMRFELELCFLDADGRLLERRRLPPRRCARHPGAAAVLELPLDA